MEARLEHVRTFEQTAVIGLNRHRFTDHSSTESPDTSHYAPSGSAPSDFEFRSIALHLMHEEIDMVASGDIPQHTDLDTSLTWLDPMGRFQLLCLSFPIFGRCHTALIVKSNIRHWRPISLTSRPSLPTPVIQPDRVSCDLM